MKKTSLIFILLTLFGLGNVIGQKSVRNVGSGQTYATIQAAVDASSNGDIINIVDAIHYEHGITVNKSITIQGQGADNTTLQGAYVSPTNPGGRIFYLYAGNTITIQDLKITKGGGTLGSNASSYGSDGGNGNSGGAIYNTATLTVKRCYFYYNIAGYGGNGYVGADGDDGAANSGNNGSIGEDGGKGGNGGYGGAIYNRYSLTVEDCTFGSNYAGGAGNGGNGGEGGTGGSGSPTGTGMAGDGATGGNGGNSGFAGSGGAIANANSGLVIITNSTFTNNSTGYSLGIPGTGGEGGMGGYGVHTDDNSMYGWGGDGGNGGTGGIAVYAGSGGAIANIDGTVRSVNNTISENTAYFPTANIAGAGGDGGNGGWAEGGGQGGDGGNGGTGGAGADSGEGGGFYNKTGETVQIINTIISSNDLMFGTSSGGEGGHLGSMGQGSGGNGSTGVIGATGASGSANYGEDCSGAFTSYGYNIIQIRTGSTGWVTEDLPGGTNPNLQTITNNGGGTITMAILSNSPANAAAATSSGVLTIPTTDQRGYDRQVAPNGYDIGAYECLAPYISTSKSSIAFGSVEVGNSSVNNYILTCTNLSTDATVTAPTGYQVSLSSSSGFATSMQVPESGGNITRTIYVKFTPTTATSYSGNVTNVSSGATTVNVAVSGTGNVAAEMIVNPTSLAFGNVTIGNSDIKSYVLTGSNLTNDVSISIPDKYTASTTIDGTYSVNLTIPETGGSINQTIYIKYTPTATATSTGNIRHTSSGATTKYVAVSGTGVQATLAISETLFQFGDVIVGSSSDEESYTLTGSNLYEDVIISISSAQGYEISLTSGSGFTTDLVVPETGGSVNQTIYARFSPESTGYLSKNIQNSSSGINRYVAIRGTGIQPTITLTPTSLGFGNIRVGETSTMSYELLGEDLNESESVSLTAPTGYQISLSSTSGFTSMLDINSDVNGNVDETVYVKFTPTSATSFNGNITHYHYQVSETNNVAVTGAGIEAALSISPTTLNFGNVPVGGSEIMSCDVTATNLTGNVTVESPDEIFLFSETIDGAYALTISLTPTNGSINKTIYVKCSPTEDGYFNESLSVYSTSDGLDEALNVDYTGVNSTLAVNPELVDLGEVLFGNTSSEMTFQLTGSNLIEDIVLFGILDYYGFEISLTSGTGFTNEITIPYGTGTINQTIYVRCSPTYSGNIVMDLEIESGTAYASVELDYTGKTTMSVTPSSLNFENVQVGSSTKLSYTLFCENLETPNGDENISITAPAGEYLVCLTENGTYASSVDAIPTNGSINQIVWVEFSPTTEGIQSGNITNTTDFADTKNVSVTGTGVPVGTPTITSSVSSINYGDVQTGAFNTQTYTVSGVDLTDDITISVTGSNYEISLDGTAFGTDNIVLTQTGGTIDYTIIFVKFSPNAIQNYTGLISNSSSGAEQVDITLNGEGVEPIISVSPSNLAFGSVEIGNSSEQSYNLTGQFLADDITVTAPTGYLISLTSGSFSTYELVITPDMNNEVSETIYVQFTPTSATDYNGNITNTSTTTTQNVAVTGTGVIAGTPTITTSLSSIDFGNVQTGSNGVQSYTIEGSDLTENITISVTGSNYEISEDGTTYGTSNIVLTQTSGNVVSTTIYVRFSPDAVQNYTGTISNISSGASQVDISLNGNGVEPILTVSPLTLDFGDVETGTTADLTYTIAGEFLTNDIEITVPDATGFTISDNNVDFGTDLTIAQNAGNVAETTIYVRFSPTSETAYSTDITNESINAETQNVAVSGNGVTAGTPIITVSITDLSFDEVEVGTETILTYTVSGTSLTDDIYIALTTGTQFTISDDNITFGTSITLAQNDGITEETTIYVKFAPDAKTDFSDIISHTSTDATTREVNLLGSSATGIFDTNNGGISIYPNPSNGIFNINNTFNSNTDIYIYNINGKLVFNSTLNSDVNFIDISSQASGIYFVKYINGSIIKTTKIVKK